MTVVSDGQLPLGPPKGTFIGVPDEQVKQMLVDNFLSPDNVVLEQNSPIVNTGDKLILFDTGMGTAKTFGPTTGRQQKSMAEAGIKPEDIVKKLADMIPRDPNEEKLAQGQAPAPVITK